MTLTTLTLLRHGETDWNMVRRWQGWAPLPLNTNGLAQAEAAAEGLIDAGIQRIISSDSLRTLQTAEPVAKLLGLPVEKDRRWREVDLGNWQGLTRDEMQAWDSAYYADFTAKDYILQVFPEGESRQEHLDRVSAAMHAAVEKYPGEHVLAVSHGGSVRMAVYYVTRNLEFIVGNCSVTRFIFDHATGQWTVKEIGVQPEAMVW